MVIGGSEDKHTPPDETRQLFDAANNNKELWVVEGAGHQDLLAFSPAMYKSRIRGFIDHIHRFETR